MSVRSPEESHVIDIGGHEWCWSRLGSAGEGVLSQAAPRGRTSLAVPYVVTDQQITIPSESFDGAGWSAADGETSLEVSGLTSDDLRWVVRATGNAVQVGPTDSRLANSRRMHAAKAVPEGSAGASAQLVLLTPRVRGFYETPLATS